MFYRPRYEPAKQIRTKSNELAPVIFFIDVIKSNNFINPVIPLPLRIDKIINGYPIFPILPKENLSIYLKNDKNEKINVDLHQFYQLGMQNLYYYTYEKTIELTFRPLDPIMAKKSWDTSKEYGAYIYTFANLMESIFSAYLIAYTQFLEKNDEIGALISYCDNIIHLCNQHIEKNQIELRYKGKDIIMPMYKKKKDKINPEILPIDYIHLEKQNQKELAFIPILLYDDLLECFLSNKESLEKNNAKIIPFNDVINLKIIQKSPIELKYIKIKFIKELSLSYPV